jgi:hypothetical protein
VVITTNGKRREKLISPSICTMDISRFPEILRAWIPDYARTGWCSIWPDQQWYVSAYELSWYYWRPDSFSTLHPDSFPVNTDWQSEMSAQPPMQNYHLSASGERKSVLQPFGWYYKVDGII